MHVNNDGAWERVADISAKVNGEWKRIKYQYVKIAGQWIRSWRVPDALYDGMVTFETVFFAGSNWWGFSNGNYGSTDHIDINDGTFLALAQTGDVERFGCAPFQYLQIAIYGNYPYLDIAEVNFAGFQSADVASIMYVEEFGVTEYVVNFGVQLPITGTHRLIF